jgi:hypothetical protein
LSDWRTLTLIWWSRTMTMYERVGPGGLGLSGVETGRSGPRSTCLPDAVGACWRKHMVLWGLTCPGIL